MEKRNRLSGIGRIFLLVMQMEILVMMDHLAFSFNLSRMPLAEYTDSSQGAPLIQGLPTVVLKNLTKCRVVVTHNRLLKHSHSLLSRLEPALPDYSTGSL